MRPFVVAAVLAGTTAPLAAQNSISIIGVDRAAAATFALITVNGHGFDSANAAISVVFSAREAITVTVPAITATANLLQVAVPPLINATSGDLFDTALVADVQVVQITRTAVATSNVLGGLTIEPPPATLAPVGTTLRAFLNTVLDVQDDLRGAHRATASFAAVLAASQAFSDAQAPLLAAAEAVIADSDAVVPLPAVADARLTIDTRTLRTADRLALALVVQANAAARGDGFVSPVGAVPAGCAACAHPASGLERELCEFRRNPCLAHENARKVVPHLAAATYGAQFAVVAAWAAGGLGDGGPGATGAATSLGLLWGHAISYVTAVLAGVNPPGSWTLLREAGAAILDAHLASDMMIFTGLAPGVSLGREIENAIVAARGEVPGSPQGGAVLPGPTPRNAPPNTRPVFAYLGPGAVRWLAITTSQQVAPIQSVTIPK